MMNRRQFLQQAAAVATSAHLSLPTSTSSGGEIFVSPSGNNAAAGGFDSPLASIERALTLSGQYKQKHGAPAVILLREGVYELASALHLTNVDMGDASRPLRIEAYGDEHVVLSGGTRLRPDWKPYRNGILQTSVPPGTTTDQLFVNDQRQIMARYPKFDPNAHYLNGTADDVLDPTRVKRWKDPAGGYVHGMQQSLWGSLHYRILGKNPDGSLVQEGGWQVDRDQPMRKSLRFVEGIFEELNAPGEWFLNEKTSTLFFYPPEGMDMDTATVDIVRLPCLLSISSSQSQAASGLILRGLTFRHTLRTFMETREQLLRSDWRIFRGGAVFFENVEDMLIEDCYFDQLGGNAIFANGHVKRLCVRGCRIADAGASGVCFVGTENSVRNPLNGYSSSLSLEQLDRTPGPCNESYPEDCTVEDCLITRTGRFEKQTAGVQISMAQSIRVIHCSIYGVPRAGINIGDGTWGGHHIEGCDVFDTVLETSDHGAFNSWGRDRWWHLNNVEEDDILKPSTQDLPTLDAILPNILSDNRWACEHGWDIDLDDGSSNFHIQRNLCLCGGIKLREGFFRQIENNITVNNTLHVHVWPADSEDIILRNIFFVPYSPIRTRGWGEAVDLNLLHRPGLSHPQPALALQQLSGQDSHSIEADASFYNALEGDFSLRSESSALSLGFEDIATKMYGVRAPHLRAIAQTPEISRLFRTTPSTLQTIRQKSAIHWMGATMRNLTSLGEMSEFGAPTETGVISESVPPDSFAAHAGLKVHDLLLNAGGMPVSDTATLEHLTGAWSIGEVISLGILREQKPMTLTLKVPLP